MGFSCYTIPIVNHSPLKSLRNFIISTNPMSLTLTHTPSNFEEGEFHPSPSLVQLPLHFINKCIKDRLPLVPYSTLKPRARANEEEEEDDQCTICLNEIEAWHKVRKLGHCDHGFHVECLESWIDQGRGTCPVCRSELFSGHGKDPWRSERMVYLFGEDCSFKELTSGNFS